MMTATSRMSMTEITDRCGHGAENCVTHGPLRSSIRSAQHFIVIQELRGRTLTRQFDLHALRRGAQPRIVVASLFNHLVDAGVVMIGVVMEQDQILRTTLCDHIDSFAPMAVSPTSFALVFLGKILRVVNQNVGASRKLSHILVE